MGWEFSSAFSPTDTFLEKAGHQLVLPPLPLCGRDCTLPTPEGAEQQADSPAFAETGADVGHP